eukprot:2789262-Alexandrium_andersonii.AAC.1
MHPSRAFGNNFEAAPWATQFKFRTPEANVHLAWPLATGKQAGAAFRNHTSLKPRVAGSMKH